jgi:hypothetical protein
MALENSIRENHGIGEFHRRKSRYWRISSEEIMELEHLIAGNREIGFNRMGLANFIGANHEIEHFIGRIHKIEEVDLT